MDIYKDIYKDVKICPWCGADGGVSESLYKMIEGGEVVRCRSCGLVYATKILNEAGLEHYWKSYESQVHIADDDKADKRKRMYIHDYNFIKPFLRDNSRVLDVGCGNGDFLDYFAKDGFECHGIEFGEEAYKISSKKYDCFYGDISEYNPPHKYELVIFRGVIQYLLHPKDDLRKAVSLLADDGLLYITASPNSDSLCFDIFLENFSVPVTPHDYYMFNENILDTYFNILGLEKICSGHIYLGTPYENYEEDILMISEAIKKKRDGGKIVNKSPAFWDNMLTIAYKKQGMKGKDDEK